MVCFNLILEILIIDRCDWSELCLNHLFLCFNLILEILIIDRWYRYSVICAELIFIVSISYLRFLSLIDSSIARSCFSAKRGFNLILEILIIDRRLISLQLQDATHRFNLILEILIIDSYSGLFTYIKRHGFQSHT